MLVNYVRDVRNGQIIATVVAIGKDNIGFAKRNKKDSFSRHLGLEIAAGRAYLRRPIDLPLDSEHQDMPFIHAIDKMRIRAAKYYK